MAQASGYYYDMDGFLHGKVGTEKKILICIGSKKSKTIKDGKEVITVEFQSTAVSTIPFDDFLEMAATTWGESSSHRNTVSETDLENEALALAYCIMNYKHKRNHDQPGGYSPANIKQICTDMKAYASGKPPYKNFKTAFNADPEKLNGTRMQNHIKSSLFAHLKEVGMPKSTIESSDNSILGGALLGILAFYQVMINFDYAYGAILWDGEDLKTNKSHPKVAQGYLVADKKHNVMNIESKKVNKCNIVRSQKDLSWTEKRCYEYMYETTCGFANSTFVKLNIKYEESIIHPSWTMKDGSYVLGTWW